MAVLDDTLVPIPPRYWWLKRILLAVAVLVVAIGGLRWWWGVQADRRWRACLARLEATGEPLYARDFAVPAIPDEENAAYFLKGAVAAMKPVRSGAFVDLADAPNSPARDREVVQALMHNAESLRLLRQVRDAPRADWGIDYSKGVLGAKPPDMTNQLELAHLAELGGIAAYQRSDIGEAMECVDDLLHQARAIRAQRTFLGHLMGMEADQCAARVVEQIAPGVTVAPSMTRREKIQALIDSFLDESEMRTSWRWAWLSERALQLEGARLVATSRAPGLFAPAFTLDAARIIEWANQTVTMAEATNVVAAHARYPADCDPAQKLNRYARLLSAFLLPGFASVVDQHFERVARRRLAAARLGVGLYELDHNKPAETLGQLVPEYLPAVPPDPLFDDGRPIEYAPGGPDAGLFAGRPRHPVILRLNPTAGGGRASSSTQTVEHHDNIER